MGQICATLDRFEADKAVLILADGQNLVISRKDLAPNLKPGDVLALNFSLSKKQTARNEKAAKKLLTKILKQNQREAG
jgi:hypothetical protein